jgi:hypothetical protein
MSRFNYGFFSWAAQNVDSVQKVGYSISLAVVGGSSLDLLYVLHVQENSWVGDQTFANFAPS